MKNQIARLDITVIIPAYNEAGRLPKTLKIIENFFASGQFSYELIVVDDGSSDNTVKWLESQISKTSAS